MNIRTLIALHVSAPIIGVAMGLGIVWAIAACYPRNCDPRTDPLKCECPPGACGDYPPEPPITQTVSDAGRG